VSVAPLPDHLHGEAVALWEACGLTRPWNDAAADLRRALQGPASTVLASVHDGQLVGTAMVGHDGHRGWLYYLAVREDARGCGLGRALVAACETWTAGHGIPKLQLMVRTGNGPVVAFYERLGYATGDVVVLGRRLD
jgi:ribosomal protein S18 acetylase RimI-like enzyme